jgi:cell division protease FtsH
MNDKVGNVSFYDPVQENAFTKPYSEETSKLIDEEVRKLIDQAYDHTKELLTQKGKEVKKLAEALLEKEVLFQSDVESLIGKRPFEEKRALDVSDHTDHNKVAMNENGTPSGSGTSVNPTPKEEVK